MKTRPMVVKRLHLCTTCPETVEQPGDGEYDRIPEGWAKLHYVEDETIRLCKKCTDRLRLWLEGQAQ